MNGWRIIAAVAAKDVRVAMVSPVFYVVAGVFLAIVGLFFSQIVTVASLQSLQMMRFQGGLPELNLTVLVFQPMFRNMHVILLLVIPLLTMRALSEERKQRTVELLTTSPITLAQVVAGKYLAVLALYIALLVGTLYMPVVLSRWGGVDWATVMSGYLGLVCVGSVYLALGLWASSFTENQISAGVMTLGMILGLWVIGWAAMTAEDTAVQSVLEYLSITGHFDRFIKGLISLDSVVYVVSVAGFGVFLAHRVMDAGRWRDAA